MNSSQASTITEVRADIWLWAARMFKTRAVAKQAIDGGKIDLNGAHCKPAKGIKVGDRLRITRGEERLECEVLGLSHKRGPAGEAQQLYRETEQSAAERANQRELRRMQGGPLRPPTRPDKHSRRLIHNFKKTL
jgi:ribosome-associated heat shock protein Hsp15